MSRAAFRNLKPSPELERLLQAAKGHKMTAQEIWDQRVSFVYGQLMDCAPEVTKEQVRAHAERIYGPRPEPAE